MDATRRATRAVGAGLIVVSLAAVLVVVIRTGGDGEVSLGTGTTGTGPPATTGSTATTASSGYVGGPTHTRLIATTVVSDLVSLPDDFSLFAHRWGAEGVIRIPAPLSAGSLLATTATTATTEG